MKRIAGLAAAIVVCLAIAPVRSQAQTVVINGYCFTETPTTMVPCVTPTVVRPLIPPTKSLTVGNAVTQPSGVTQYDVNLVSRLLCFALSDEPIELTTLANSGSSVFTPVFPAFVPSRGSTVEVHVDRATGTAMLHLEVLRTAAASSGVVVKAVWPDEGVERLVSVVAPPPAPTPSATAAGVPPPTATPLPQPSPTPGGTAAPVATATPVEANLFARACVTPPVLRGATLGGDSPTLYGWTLPGATCTAGVTYSTGQTPASFVGSPQVALGDGLVVFSWDEATSGDYGIATVTCSVGASAQTACSAFLVAQHVPGVTDTRSLLTLPTDQIAALQAYYESRLCPPGSVTEHYHPGP